MEEDLSQSSSWPRSVGRRRYTAFSEDVLHFVYVEVEGDELRLHAIDATGQRFDSVAIENPTVDTAAVNDGSHPEVARNAHLPTAVLPKAEPPARHVEAHRQE